MFLNHLTLRNLRCFDDASIDFGAPEPADGNRKWTVVIGENGSGKSSVLKAVALVMGGSDALTELVGNPDDWIGYGHDEAYIELVIETSAGETRQLSLRFKRGSGLSRFLADSVKSLEPLNSALEHADRNYPTFAFGSSRRLGGKGVSSENALFRQRRAQAMASLFSRDAALNPLESWAMQLDYQTNGDALHIVRDVLSDFLPEISFSHIDKKKEQLIFNTLDGNVPLSQLSDGYQNVAAWVGDLLYRVTETFEDYQNPLNVRGLLIIDEVDLHLHPIWQRRLLDFLEKRLPRMQLLVTTHSLVTAQQAPENSLYYCIRRQGSSPAIKRFDADPGKYLLHQLAATEAFGQLSDESLEVEHLKSEYRELQLKPAASDSDEQRMATITDKLAERPLDTNATPVLTPEQVTLMEAVLKNVVLNEGGGNA